MPIVSRVLPPEPVASLRDYLDGGGGRGLQAARRVEPDVLIAEIEASGLRGRGGAGFPTGVKWRTVAANASPDLPTTVVVNGAEGEPGTFKDRMILRRDPYRVLEGALVAARAVGATAVVVALKRAFTTEVARVRDAIAEVQAEGLDDGVALSVFEGPEEYLYGEETALLEVLDGRHPFPRVAPPFRRGVVELVETPADVDSESNLPATVEMAGPGDDTDAPPALVNNVETMANVAAIIAEGAGWFRTIGTADSPGTVVCTITGAVRAPGVAEVALGTPVREVIDTVAGGALPGRTITALLAGVSGAVLHGDLLDTPLSYEGMAAAGTWLGSAGFIVLDDLSDPVAVAAGASRFLAVESCGQCTPCKDDGLALAAALDRLSRTVGDEHDVREVESRLSTVGDQARCSLAGQHQTVVSSLLRAFPEAFRAHAAGTTESLEPALVAELVDLDRERGAIYDTRHRDKQPDWTYDDEYSGKWPAQRFDDHRAD